jgi:hypothetical protein
MFQLALRRESSEWAKAERMAAEGVLELWVISGMSLVALTSRAFCVICGFSSLHLG